MMLKKNTCRRKDEEISAPRAPMTDQPKDRRPPARPDRPRPIPKYAKGSRWVIKGGKGRRRGGTGRYTINDPLAQIVVPLCNFGSFQSQVSERTDGYPARPPPESTPHHQLVSQDVHWLGGGGPAGGVGRSRSTPLPTTGYVAGGSLVRNFRTENGSRSRKKRTPQSEPPHLQASAPLACNLPPSSVGPTGCHLGPLTQKLDVPLSSFLHTKLCGR